MPRTQEYPSLKYALRLARAILKTNQLLKTEQHFFSVKLPLYETLFRNTIAVLLPPFIQSAFSMTQR